MLVFKPEGRRSQTPYSWLLFLKTGQQDLMGFVGEVYRTFLKTYCQMKTVIIRSFTRGNLSQWTQFLRIIHVFNT